MSDEDQQSYMGGQNGSPYTGSSGQNYANWENGNREYKAFQENLNGSPYPSHQPQYGPVMNHQVDNHIPIPQRKSHYRGKGAVAAALTIAGGYVTYISISSTYGLYIMILSAIALGIIILSIYDESKWHSISLLIISAPLLWAIVQLVWIHYLTFDQPSLALAGGVIVVLASLGIVVTGVRGLIQNGERLLTKLSIIYVVLLTVWAIWSFRTFGT